MRVRQLIPLLEYHSLIKQNIIPRLFDKVKVDPATHPSALRGQVTYSGVYMEFVVTKILQVLGKVKHPFQSIPDHLKNDPGYISLVADFMCSPIEFDSYSESLKKLLAVQLPYFNSIKKITLPKALDYNKLINKLQKLNNAELEVEIRINGLEGHPDVITCNNGIYQVYDVKTTGDFKSMKKDSILQILLYVMLLRANGKTVSECGIILPLQSKILKYDTTNWDSSEFLIHIISLIEHIRDQFSKADSYNFNRYVGSHVALEKNIYDSILRAHKQYNTTPIQIFLASPKRHTELNMKDIIPKVKDFVTNNSMCIYTHAPYYINLAKPKNEKSVNEKGSWVVKRLRKELKYSNKMGFKGVVFHTGKSLKLNVKKANKVFYKTMKKCMKYATIECPLLLETPAGQGTEMYVKIEEFAKIAKKMIIKYGKRFGICIDTCHVFASGYNPMNYMIELAGEIGIDNICLIHFNGSKGDLGCKLDRHCHITMGAGKIPMDVLMNVMHLCMQHKIDMVTE